MTIYDGQEIRQQSLFPLFGEDTLYPAKRAYHAVFNDLFNGSEDEISRIELVKLLFNKKTDVGSSVLQSSKSSERKALLRKAEKYASIIQMPESFMKLLTKAGIPMPDAVGSSAMSLALQGRALINGTRSLKKKKEQ